MMTVEAPAKAAPTIWRPHAGAQTRLVTCPYNEILYGGAKGGGKSDGILGNWLAHQARNPRWARGIIFRKTYPELEQLIARSHEIFAALGASWKEQKKTWYFPGGATLKFRFLETEREAQSYQGHEYTWIAFDEVGDLEDEAVVNTLRGALRSSKDVKERILLLCGNPLGAGHKWIKRRFIDASPPEVPTFERLTLPATGASPEVTLTWSRVFIPALLEDNPTLQANDPGYALRLQQMCVGRPWLYRALRFGDWTVRREVPGALLTEEQIEQHRVSKAPTMAQVALGVDPTVKGYDPEMTQDQIDFELGDECGIFGIGQGVDEKRYFLVDATLKGDPTVWSRRAVETAVSIGASVIWAEANNGGALVKNEITRRMEEMEIKGIRVVLVTAREGKYIRASGMAADVLNGSLFFVGEFPKFEEQMTTFIPKVNKPSPNNMDAAVWAWVGLTGNNSEGILNFYKKQVRGLDKDQQEAVEKRLAQVREVLKNAPTVGGMPQLPPRRGGR